MTSLLSNSDEQAKPADTSAQLHLPLPGSEARTVSLIGRLWEELGAFAVARTDEEVIATFTDKAEAEAAAEALDGGDVQRLEGTDHLDAWQAWAQPTRVGRIVVRPSWVEPDPEDELLLDIPLDPGHAFGHGGHPSTRLLLVELERRLRPGHAVLDIGSGSGVLAIAAARLGAGRVLTTDIDPQAVMTTNFNVAANHVGEVVTVSQRPLATVADSFDAVVANLGIVVFRALVPALAERVGPTGWLGLSGLLHNQLDEVVALVGDGWQMDYVGRESGWVAPVFVRVG